MMGMEDLVMLVLAKVVLVTAMYVLKSKVIYALLVTVVFHMMCWFQLHSFVLCRVRLC